MKHFVNKKRTDILPALDRSFRPIKSLFSSRLIFKEI